MFGDQFLGIISDTHGLLSEETASALAGASLILHAGDVGKLPVLDVLSRVAPVVAVRGNVDRGEWAESLPLSAAVEWNGHSLFMLHDLKELDLDPVTAGFSVVISGHTHRPLAEETGGVLYLNPGSAGPRRFSLPICLARLRRSEGVWKVEFVDVTPAARSGVV